jgi:hypothetical protein
MTASTTASVNFDLFDLVEEAFERATGGNRMMQTGYDYKTARRSLNLLTMEWANRGINMWTLDQGTIPLVAGLAGYQLPADTIDMLDFALRTNSGLTSQTDVPLVRVSVPQYNALVNKNATGRPTQVMVQRISPYPVMTLWPVPDNDNYVLVGWRLRRIHDASAPGSQTMDVPFRFVPALVAGLAYYISMKVPEGTPYTANLKADYDELFGNASMEDRDRSTTVIVPKIGRV